MNHKYGNVSRYTAVFIARQSDRIDPQEMIRAISEDAKEPATHKAWRGILEGHDNIKYQIGEVRRSLYDMGCPMTPRGKKYIHTLLIDGRKWCDPAPNVTLTESQKRLLLCIADMPRRWAALREAEKGDSHA